MPKMQLLPLGWRRGDCLPGDRSCCPYCHGCSGHQVSGKAAVSRVPGGSCGQQSLVPSVLSHEGTYSLFSEAHLANEPQHHPSGCTTEQHPEELPPPSGCCWCSCGRLPSAHLPLPGSGQGRFWRGHLSSILCYGHRVAFECNRFSKHWDSILLRFSFSN